MRNALRAVRSALLGGARATGLLSAISRSSWRGHRLLILCYHGVSLADEHEWSDLFVSPSLLDDRLRTLRSLGANVLPLHTAVEQLYTGTLPPLAVALTFDDGLYDFLARAHPILESHEVPSTLYLTTYHVEHPVPVFNPLISYLMWKARGQSLDLPLGVGRHVMPLSARDPAHLALLEEVRRRARPLDADTKVALAREFAMQANIDFDAICAGRLFTLLRPSEVQQLNPARVSVQLHTHRHRVPREAQAFTREIVDNREAITRVLGDRQPLVHFCYPSGEYHDDFLPWLERAGVITATTCAPGIASANDHPLVLPRFIDTGGVSPITFEAWVSGFGSLVGRRPSPQRRRVAA